MNSPDLIRLTSDSKAHNKLSFQQLHGLTVKFDTKSTRRKKREKPLNPEKKVHRGEILRQIRRFAQEKCVPTFDINIKDRPQRVFPRKRWAHPKRFTKTELLVFIRGQLECNQTDYYWAIREIRNHPHYYGMRITGDKRQVIDLVYRLDGRDRYDRNDPYCWDNRPLQYVPLTVASSLEIVLVDRLASRANTIWMPQHVRIHKPRCPVTCQNACPLLLATV